MHRQIKFRAKAVHNNEWVFGNFIHSARFKGCGNEFRIHDPETGVESDVDPDTVGQFTGLKDKNGVEVYEGDVIQFREVYRTTQTHTGDNIPNGSYTEPMEPEIRIIESDIVFSESELAWGINDYDSGDFRQLSWINWIPTMEYIESVLSIHKDWFVFDDPEGGEGDLQYLFEITGTSTNEELINYLSGLEIIGNIYDNPDLIS